MLNRLDYSYNGEESIVHRLNPVVKIFGLVVYVLICLLQFDYLLFVISTGFVFLLLNTGFVLLYILFSFSNDTLSNYRFFRYC